MGKATRWLKGLLGMKKEKEKEKFNNSSYHSNDNRDKKRWSFAKLGTDSDSVGDVPANIEAAASASHTAWFRSYIADTEKEQKKHAIAVAAATAAAADAAVAAAQAAVAVVRLTNQGRVSPLQLGEVRERLAAVKIQTVFRGFLARKALRALKALVKLQALVRGYLVRKQTTATFYSMQALIRAQTAVRTQRARRSISKENRQYPQNRPRKSIEKIEEARSESYSKRMSTACHEVPLNVLDESPKIVEIDTYMTGSRSTRISNSNTLSEYGEDQSSQAMSSPLVCSIPCRLSVPDSKQFEDHDHWYYFNGDDCKFPTAQSTPRFANFVRRNSPSTPAKSVSGDCFFRPYCNVPSYMANTQSFRAKLRSHSAPKQRPEQLGPKKVSLHEVMAARNSISSVRMHRPSYTHVQEYCNF